MARKVRLDVAVVEAGLVPTRARARAVILAGKIQVDGQTVTKAGAQVSPDATVTLRLPDIPYVGRGGVKLAGALDRFHIDVSGKVWFDVGASTGGFTQCLLERGALRVYAIDVGHGQLDWSLRNDPRVVVHERTNARYLDEMAFPESAGGAVIDVSFISVTRILGPLRTHLEPFATVMVLVKPQFEAGRREVGKGGIVRDPGVRQRAIDKVKVAAQALGYRLRGEVPSSIPGAKGNVEHFLYLTHGVSGAAGGDPLS